MSSKKIGEVREVALDFSKLAGWAGLGASVMSIGYEVYLGSKISSLDIDVKRIGDDVKNIGAKMGVHEREISVLKEETSSNKSSVINHEKTIRRILMEFKNIKKALKENKITVKKIKIAENNRNGEVDLIDEL